MLSKTPNEPNLLSVKTLLEQSQPSTSLGKRPSDGTGGPGVKKPNIDTRTDPSQDTNPTHTASGVKRALDGTIYQSKLLGLFTKRGVDKQYDFRLATEMDAAGKFDDVVFKYKSQGKWNYRFLQAKHKQDAENKKITINDLTSTSDQNPFSLQKYVVSFCKIKDNELFEGAELKDFVIITNTDFDFSENFERKKDGSLTKRAQEHNELINKWKSFFEKEQDLKQDEILYFEIKDFRAEKFKFSGNVKADLIEVIKSTLLKSALETKEIKDLSSAKEKLEATKVLNLSDLITKADKAVRNIGNEYKNKKRKGEVLKEAREVSKLKENILEENKYKDLDKAIDELNKTPGKDKNKQKLDDAIKKVLDEANGISNEVNNLLNEAKKTLREYESLNSNKANELAKDKNKLNDIENNLKKIKDKISEPKTTLDDIKEEIKEELLAKRIPKVTVEEIKKKTNSDLEEVKDILEKKIGGIISEISGIRVALNDDSLEIYLKEFLEKFRFVTNYPNEKELGVLIKNELGEKFHLLNSDLVSDSFEREMLDFLKSYDKGKAKFYSWKNAQHFFTALKVNINTLITSGLSKAYPETLRAYGVGFKNNLETMKGFLSKQEKILHVSTQAPQLSAIHVLDTLESDGFKNTYSYLKKEDGYIFMRLKTLLHQKTQDLVIDSFSSQTSHDLLVVECPLEVTQDQANDIKQLSKKLSKPLQSLQKKIILIAQSQDVLANKLKGFNKYSTLRDDEISFKQLNTNSQKKVLEKYVNFQGKDISLNQLISKGLADEIIDHAILLRFLQERKIQIGNTKAFSSIGYVPDYYIERSLHLQNIKAQVLKEKISHGLFFITGVSDKSDLTTLGVEEKFINLWADRQTYQDGIIMYILDQGGQEAFTKICERHSGKSIHWLEYKEGTLLWRDYMGSLSLVNGYIEGSLPDRKNALEEGNLSKPEDPKRKVVILANESGEGKSTVLTSLAHKMKEQFGALWVQRVDLNDYTEESLKNSLEKIKFTENDVSRAIVFLLNMVVPEGSEHLLERILFARGLQRGVQGSHYKIVLFFDGFDEISPTYKEKTINLLKALKESNISQLWVTTRVHEKTYLEEQLESTAYLLNPLSREEQETFLDKFWSWYYKKEENVGSVTPVDSKMEVDQPELSLSAKKWLKEWIKSIGNKNRDFNLVPLNLKMLAEVVFEKGSQLPEKLDLPELYDAFIKAKFGIYHQDKSRIPQGNVAAKDIIKRDLENLHRVHRELAAKLLFPEEKSLPDLDKPLQFTKPELTRIGLLSFGEEKFEFTHGSFAEYFLSDYLINNLQNEQVKKFLLKEVLPKDNYKLTRKFLNSLLLKNISSPIIPKTTSSAKTYHQDDDIVVLREFGKSNLLNKLILENHFSIIKHLIDEFPDHSKNMTLETDSFEPTVLHVAAYEGHRETMTALLVLIKNDRNILKELILKQDLLGCTALHWAAQEGHHEAVQALLEPIRNDQPILKELILKQDVDGQTASHWAAQEGSSKALKIIEDFAKKHDIFDELMKIKNNDERTIPEITICL